MSLLSASDFACCDNNSHDMRVEMMTSLLMTTTTSLPETGNWRAWRCRRAHSLRPSHPAEVVSGGVPGRGGQRLASSTPASFLAVLRLPASERATSEAARGTKEAPSVTCGEPEKDVVRDAIDLDVREAGKVSPVLAQRASPGGGRRSRR